MTEAVKVIKPEYKLYYTLIDVKKTHTFGYLMQRGVENGCKYKAHVLISPAERPPPPRVAYGVYTLHTFIFRCEGPAPCCTPSPVSASPLKRSMSAITVTSHMVMNSEKRFEFLLYLLVVEAVRGRKKKLFQFYF